LAREDIGSFHILLMFGLLLLSCLVPTIKFRHELLMRRLSMALLSLFDFTYA